MVAYCKRCALHIPDGVSSCRMCGSSVLSESPGLIEGGLIGADPAQAAPEPGFSKWLFYVGLSLIAAPALGIYSIAHNEIPALFSDYGRTLILEHPGLDKIISFEICMNVVLALAALVLNVFFYTRSKFFPMAMVVFVAVTFAFRVTVTGFVHALFPEEVLTHTAWTLVRYLAWCGSLAGYLLLNRDVDTRFQN